MMIMVVTPSLPRSWATSMTSAWAVLRKSERVRAERGPSRGMLAIPSETMTRTGMESLFFVFSFLRTLQPSYIPEARG